MMTKSPNVSNAVICITLPYTRSVSPAYSREEFEHYSEPTDTDTSACREARFRRYRDDHIHDIFQWRTVRSLKVLCIFGNHQYVKREGKTKKQRYISHDSQTPLPSIHSYLRRRKPHQAATPTFEAPALAFLLLRTAPGLASVYFANALPNCLLQLIF